MVATRAGAPRAAALWGFTRCLAIEHPELRPMLVEVETDDVDQVIAAVDTDDGPAWRRVRDGQLQAGRVVPMPLAAPLPLPITAHASYLITGGLGSIGCQLARTLATQGARRIILAGRRRGDVPDLGDACEVVWRACDVRNAGEVSALIADLAAADRPLRGIIHAAGTRHDRPILTLDAATITEAMAAKVDGAWHLHEATRHLPMDFFVLMSSAAGVLGSPGQSAYAAANACLDALAQERARLGLPAVSIAWGPWRESAMFAGLSAAQHQAWTARGIRPLTSEDALSHLGSIAGSGQPAVLYVDADWARVARMWHTPATPDFLSALLPPPAPAVSVESPAEAREDWPRLSPEEARARMTRTLRDEVRTVLALDRPFASETSFFDLGMDSLTALELRNALQSRFGLALPATLLFDYPSVEPLRAWLLRQLHVREDDGDEPSEAELERLLLAKIASIERTGT